MANDGEPDYQALYHEAEALRRAEEQRRVRAEERSQHTTLDEYLLNCHRLLSEPLEIGHPDRSTRGQIPPPKKKVCPFKLDRWLSFETQQAQVFAVVRRYLQPAHEPQRQFSSYLALEDLGRRLSRRSINSEKDLEAYARRAVEEHVQDIVEALCRSPEARQELQLDCGLRFDNHGNDLGEDEDPRRINAPVGEPDQFCIHRHGGDNNTLITTVEYKPPHKLSIATLCAGLRPMEFWKEVVAPVTVPTDEDQKLLNQATRLAGSAIVQEYHVMIQEGLPYSFLSTGEALVFLHVPQSDPGILQYHLCVPNADVAAAAIEDRAALTAVARVLCLCLMGCELPARDNNWRNHAFATLPTWETSFALARDQLSDDELDKTPSGSEYIPTSSPRSSPAVASRSRRCAPAQKTLGNLEESSDSDSPSTTAHGKGHKRNLSEVASSSPPSRPPPDRGPTPPGPGHRRSTTAFCTQRCLSGLRRSGALDHRCPNVERHRQGRAVEHHLISASQFVQLLKQQLEHDPDHLCAPHGERGASAAPFKIVLATYDYTVIGKGTSSQQRFEISREAAIYGRLQSIQGAVVPVCLGILDLSKFYFLHGFGPVRVFLLLGWGGEALTTEQKSTLTSDIVHCKDELTRMHIRHGDWHPRNMLWNVELGRILAIDFGKSTIQRPLDKPLKDPRVMSLKRSYPSGESPTRPSRPLKKRVSA